MTIDVAPKPVNISASLARLFATEVYRAEFDHEELDHLIKHLDFACRKMAREHTKGREWSDRNGVIGYTSYGTIKNMADYAPVFAELRAIIDSQVLYYAQTLDMDLGDKSLVMQDCWINILNSRGSHASHFHASSVISGTFYVAMPDEASVITFEDPRMAMMMHSPPRNSKAALDRQIIVPMQPKRGTLLLWESWLRHAVSTNRATSDRISISFNYDLV